jgi:thioredoxin 1
MALVITDSNFNEVVKQSELPVLVDFWAAWCGPCLAIGPSIEQLATEFEGHAVVGKIDIDANSVIPQEYGVRNIPTLLIFKNGQVVDKIVGAVAKSVIQGKLQAQVA